MLTIFSFNIENLAPHLAEDAPEPLSAIVHGLGAPEIVCLQEVRLRPEDEALILRMESALPGYDCHYCLCRDKKNVTFRGGRMYGVATYVKRSLGEVLPATFAWDFEGRAVVTEIERERLAIVNLYAVNGTSKPYWDHDRGRFEGDRHQFKRRFNERLMQECQALQARGLELVLIGDFNISRTATDIFPRLRTEAPHALARKLFNEVFLRELHVTDIFRQLHPAERKYTWFNRQAPAGKVDAARVDFALVSDSLVPRVVEADILEDPAVRFGSDHAPLYVKLDSLNTV